MDNELAGEVIERPQHGDTLLAYPDAGTRKSAPTATTRAREGWGNASLVDVEKNDVAPLGPAGCVVAGAGPRVPSRFPSDVLCSVCRGRRQRNFFRKGFG
jgi:hypothetical protein